MQTLTLKCCSCGAPISVPEGSMKITCQYCGVETLLEPTPGIKDQELVDRITSLEKTITATKPSPPPLPIEDSPTTGAELSDKSWGNTLFLAVFLGWLGVHRFYVGKIGTGFLQTFTFGGCFVWQLVDIFSILSGSFTDSKGRPLNRNLKANRPMMKIVSIFAISFMALQMVSRVQPLDDGSAALLFIGVAILLVILMNWKKIIQMIKK